MITVSSVSNFFIFNTVSSSIYFILFQNFEVMVCQGKGQREGWLPIETKAKTYLGNPRGISPTFGISLRATGDVEQTIVHTATTINSPGRGSPRNWVLKRRWHSLTTIRKTMHDAETKTAGTSEKCTSVTCGQDCSVTWLVLSWHCHCPTLVVIYFGGNVCANTPYL